MIEVFTTLRKFEIKLNSTKCTFNETNGKFLGHLVIKRGIEANPDQILAIQNMNMPTTQKKVQELANKLVALSLFISHLTDWCNPIFTLLKKKKNIIWDQECTHAFKKLKEHLAHPLILSTVQPSEIIYSTISKQAVSVVLFQNEKSDEKHIYYVIKALLEAKRRYCIDSESFDANNVSLRT